MEMEQKQEELGEGDEQEVSRSRRSREAVGWARSSLSGSQTALSAVSRVAHAGFRTLCLQCDAMPVVVDIGVGVGR